VAGKTLEFYAGLAVAERDEMTPSQRWKNERADTHVRARDLCGVRKLMQT
jgi:hypothetical protein